MSAHFALLQARCPALARKVERTNKARVRRPGDRDQRERKGDDCRWLKDVKRGVNYISTFWTMKDLMIWLILMLIDK